MRNHFLTIVSIALLMASCKEDEVPSPQNPVPGNVLEVLIKFSTLKYENKKLRIDASVNSKDGFTVQKRGICFGPQSFPQIGKDSLVVSGDGFGDFTSEFSPTNYSNDVYARAFAISVSSAGKTDTTYGNQVVIKPYHQLKSFSTKASFTDSILVNWSGLSTCKIPGLESVLTKGICWSKLRGTLPAPGNFVASTAADSLGFQFFATGLESGTVYFFRVFAANAADTVFGPEFGCSTGIIDADSNYYPTVLLGNQVWMASNLRVTKFSGSGTDSLRNYSDNASWDTLHPASANSANNNLFGRYYNHYAVMSTRQLCPTGWKIPGRNDWDSLFNTLGGWENAGLAMKAGTTAWGASIAEGQGSSGFNALPAGKKLRKGEVTMNGKLAFWWAESPNSAPVAYRINNLEKGIYVDEYPLGEGLSVRCIKRR